MLVVVDTPSTSTSTSASTSTSTPSSVAGERTVVVVEDDANIADLVDIYLRDAGFRVLVAESGDGQKPRRERNSVSSEAMGTRT